MKEFPQIKQVISDSHQLDREIRPMVTFKNGYVYFGEWNTQTSETEGLGIWIWIDGTVYRGESKNGMKNSMVMGRIISRKGTFIKANGLMEKGMDWNDGVRYEGDWLNNTYHGYGVLNLNSGDKYEEQFIDGVIKGFGTYTWANGDMHEGQWKDSQSLGYVGQWRKNQDNN
eukprot:403371378